jgi:hypothetical protein
MFHLFFRNLLIETLTSLMLINDATVRKNKNQKNNKEPLIDANKTLTNEVDYNENANDNTDTECLFDNYQSLVKDKLSSENPFDSFKSNKQENKEVKLELVNLCLFLKCNIAT